MKILRYQTIGLFLLITCVCWIPSVSQTKVDQRSSLNTVSGKVSLKGKGISGIVVSVAGVNSNSRNSTYTGRTDQDGNYRIGNIPRGTYQVAPAASEFALPENRPTMLILTEGENVDSLDFALVRGAVITGKVTAAGNQPLIEATISYTIERTDASGQSSRTESRFQTDDRGIFRIFGLTPGQYKISAEPSRFSGQPGRFPKTYYPGTPDPAKATPVDVTEGSEVTTDINVELTDRSSEKFTVKGRIVDGLDGQPVPNITLRLQQLEQNSTIYLNSTATSDAQGQFNFEDVAPGQYAVIGEPTPNSSLGVDRLTFVVTDRDVTDLVIKVVRTSSLSGVVVLEGAQNKTSLSQLGLLFLRAYAPSDGGVVKSSQVAADGSFHLTGLRTGITNLNIGARFGPPPKGLTISRVERDGVAQNNATIEIKDDEIITGVRVFLKYATGSVSGSVKVANGELPPNAQVSVWLNNPQGGPRSFQPSPFVDSRGHFVIEGVADGTYEVNATVVLPGARRALTAKQQVIVSDGNVAETTLTVDMTPDAGIKQ